MPDENRPRALPSFLPARRVGAADISSAGRPGAEAVSRQVRHLLAQVIGFHVRVALGGGDAGVAQQLLEGAKVGRASAIWLHRRRCQ
jgi:hypothetical protein